MRFLFCSSRSCLSAPRLRARRTTERNFLRWSEFFHQSENFHQFEFFHQSNIYYYYYCFNWPRRTSPRPPAPSMWARRPSMAAAMPEGPSGGRARPWRASCGAKQIFFGVGAAENYCAACRYGKAALARLAPFGRPCHIDRTARRKRRPASPSEKNFNGAKDKSKRLPGLVGPGGKGGESYEPSEIC